MSDLGDQIKALEAASARVQAERDSLREENQQLRRKLNRAVSAPGLPEAEKNRLAAQVADLQSKLDASKKIQAELGKDRAQLIAAAGESEESARRRLNEVREQVARQARALSSKDAELQQVRNERDTARSKIPVSGSASDAEKELRGQLASAQATSEAFKNGKAAADKRANALRDRLQAAETRVTELSRTLSDQAKDHAETRRLLADANTEISRLIGVNEAVNRKLTQVSDEGAVVIEGLKAQLAVAKGRKK